MSAVTDALNDLGVGSLASREIVFLTGAGISVPDPTAFPLGQELYQIVLRSFTEMAPAESTRALATIPFEHSCEIIGSVFRSHPS